MSLNGTSAALGTRPDPKYTHRGQIFAALKLEVEALTTVVMTNLMSLP